MLQFSQESGLTCPGVPYSAHLSCAPTSLFFPQHVKVGWRGEMQKASVSCDLPDAGRSVAAVWTGSAAWAEGRREHLVCFSEEKHAELGVLSELGGHEQEWKDGP